MVVIPEPTVTIASLIDKAHEDKSERPRSHMGCSTLGHDCERWLWLSFRWAVQKPFSGRILRLFRRGHNEEATVYEDLKAIGCKITDTQTRVDFGSHVGGSLDGCITGVPGAPKKNHVLEIKTHGKKSFDALEKDGVYASKLMHWAQMQVYMLGVGTNRALYYAVCKDDDRIYTERVELDKESAQKIVDRGKRIAMQENMPDPVRTDETNYKCRWCAGHDMCYGSKTTKHVNCRTCAHITPKDDGTWSCERHNADNIPVDFQHKGCDDHVLHPDLVVWERAESTDPNEAVYIIDGHPIRNGRGDAHTFASSELLANPSACVDSIMGEIKAIFPDAKVVG